MKPLLVFLLTLIAFIESCKTNQQKPGMEKIDADSLVSNIDQYVGKMVETRGTVVHICGVSQKKMKLRSSNGQVIKIVPMDSLQYFDTSLCKKKVTIIGKVQKSQILLCDLDIKERERALLCHIDYTNCIDTAWVNNLKRLGKADSISTRQIKSLQNRIKSANIEYITVVAIVAEKWEVLTDSPSINN